MPTQGVESARDGTPSLVEDLAGNTRDALSEDRANLLAVEGMEALHQKALDQQDFGALGKAIGERSNDPEPAIEEIGDAEAERKRECGLSRSTIAETPLAPRRFRDRVRIAEHDLHGRRRRDPVGEHLEDERVLLVAEGDEGDGQAVPLAQLRRRGLAGTRGHDPRIVGYDHALEGRCGEGVRPCDLVRRLARLGVGQL